MQRLKRVETFETIEGLFDKFQQHNQIKWLSSHTLEYYRDTIRHFFDFCHETGIVDLSAVNSNIFDDFILWMENKYQNHTTINCYIRAARAFLYFYMSQGLVEPFKIHAIKEEEKAIEIYSDTEIAKLIQKPNLKKYPFAQYRDWIMCIYFLETGNRLQSVINIKVSDVHFDENYIVLRWTKNKHQQIVPITRALATVLPDYISTWGLSPESYLFPNAEGQQLDENSLKNSMNAYNKSRGVTKTGIHRFRHTFAAKFIQNGGGAFQLQRLMGHRSIATTQKYVHLFATDLAKAAEDYSICGNIQSNHKRLQRNNKL